MPRSSGVPGIKLSQIAAQIPATAMGVLSSAQSISPIAVTNALPFSLINISRLLLTQPGRPRAIKNAKPTINILRWLCMSTLNKT